MQFFTNYIYFTGVIDALLEFLLYMSAKFESDVFLSRDALLARHMPLSCARLCGVYVAYRRMSDWTRLRWPLHR